MAVKLVKVSMKYQEQIKEMLDEWKAYNEAHPEANQSPRAIFEDDHSDFEVYMKGINNPVLPEGYVPGTTYFCYDETRNLMIGAVNIRHYLNESLRETGGHIGDGVRPSERRKGYTTKMIGLSLEKCKELGIDRVLLVCDKENTGSAKSIIRNGGVLENEIKKDGKWIQRYWIDLSGTG